MTRAVIETPVDRAAAIARALRPDHTDDMHTEVADGTIRTRIDRQTTRSLQSTADDYVVNLTVATRVDAVLDDRFTTETDTTDQQRDNDQ